MVTSCELWLLKGEVENDISVFYWDKTFTAVKQRLSTVLETENRITVACAAGVSATFSSTL